MSWYILTDDFRQLSETSGIVENVSGFRAEINTTGRHGNGIVLYPRQKLCFTQSIYAARLKGEAGWPVIATVPFNCCGGGGESNPGLVTLPPDTIPPDTVPPDTIPPDTVPPDTIPPVTLPSYEDCDCTCDCDWGVTESDCYDTCHFVEDTLPPVTLPSTGDECTCEASDCHCDDEDYDYVPDEEEHITDKDIDNLFEEDDDGDEVITDEDIDELFKD